jgi:hypothetical protein
MAATGIISSAIAFVNLHQEGPLRTTPVVKEYSVIRNVHEPLQFSCFQIQAIKDFCQGLMIQANPNQPLSRGRRIFNQIFKLFDKAYLYVPGLTRDGGRVWKMPGRLLAEVRNWILTRVAANNQEEEVLASQIVSDLMKSMQVGQFYILAQTLDLAETICFIGYLAWAEGEGRKPPGRTCTAKVIGGNKTLTARVVLEPRTWADAWTVLTTDDLRHFRPSDVRHQTIQLQAGGEVILLSVRIWIPTTSGRSRGFWIVCVEQDSRNWRPIGSFGLAPGTIQLGISSSMMVRIKDDKLMFRHSSGWQIWKGGYQGVLPQDPGSTSSDSEEEESGQDALDEEEEEIVNPITPEGEEEEPDLLGYDDEEEIVSPTISELEEDGEGHDDSLPAFTILKKDGKARSPRRRTTFF